MKAYWITLFLLGVTNATLLREGCYVRTNFEQTMFVDSPFNFTVQLPLRSDFGVFLPTINLTWENNPSQDKNIQWAPVQLSFDPKLQLKHRNGSIIIDSNNDVDTNGPQQRVKFRNVAMLPNCPQGEPVWYKRSSTTKLFNLEERPLAFIPKNNPQVIFNIGNNNWTMNCPAQSGSLDMCDPEKKYKISVNKSNESFKIHFDDQPSPEILLSSSSMTVSLIKGSIYLIELAPEVAPEGVPKPCPDTHHWITMGLTIVVAFLIVSIMVNLMLCYYLPRPVKKSLFSCGHSTDAPQNNSRTVEDQSTSVEEKPNHRPHLHQILSPQPSGQSTYTQETTSRALTPTEEDYIPMDLTQRPSFSGHGVHDDDSPYSFIDPNNSRKTTSSLEVDYITPNAVRPLEVQLLIQNKIIQGNVVPEEVQGNLKKKPTPKGNYINLDNMVKPQRPIQPNVSEEPDYINYTSPADMSEEPDYMNYNSQLHQSQEPDYMMFNKSPMGYSAYQ